MNATLINKTIFASILMSVSIVLAKPELDPDSGKIKVAIIDTGINRDLFFKPTMCAKGHKDFTGTGLQDSNGHGSHISGLIDQYVKDMPFNKGFRPPNLQGKKVEYCQIIIKFYDSNIFTDTGNTTVEAIEHAIKLKVDYINYSAGGLKYIESEAKVIKKALDAGITVIVAAGNEHSDLTKVPYYPAVIDPRLIVVGNTDFVSKKVAPSSNYGSAVDAWEIGTNRISYGSGKKLIYLSGTSQATAIHTGKLIKKKLEINKP